MRPLLLLPLLALSTAGPAAAQAVAIPVRCHGTCPERLPATLALDSLLVSTNIANGGAATYVSQVIRNATDGAIDAAFFFPLPEDAEVTRVAVYEGRELEVYDDWSRPEESRWIMEGIARERPDAAPRGYAGRKLVHVHVPSIPANGSQYVQIGYTQPVRVSGETLSWRYPLSIGSAASQLMRLVMEIDTEAGFRDIRSPTHDVDVRWGSKSGRCPPRARCGTTNVPSELSRVVILWGGNEVRPRDFELVYIPTRAASRSDTDASP